MNPCSRATTYEVFLLALL